MTDEKTNEPNIGTMNSAELERHIKELDTAHKKRMSTLRALMRARKAEEEAK